jgi:hypothetical protein
MWATDGWTGRLRNGRGLLSSYGRVSRNVLERPLSEEHGARTLGRLSVSIVWAGLDIVHYADAGEDTDGLDGLTIKDLWMFEVDWWIFSIHLPQISTCKNAECLSRISTLISFSASFLAALIDTDMCLQDVGCPRCPVDIPEYAGYFPWLAAWLACRRYIDTDCRRVRIYGRYLHLCLGFS